MRIMQMIEISVYMPMWRKVHPIALIFSVDFSCKFCLYTMDEMYSS